MVEQEEIWVKAALAGDKHSFSRLVEAYQRPVFNLAYRMLGNPDEAEDAAQETFLRAYARLRQYDDSHKFSTWILSIANHHCIDGCANDGQNMSQSTIIQFWRIWKRIHRSRNRACLVKSKQWNYKRCSTN